MEELFKHIDKSQLINDNINIDQYLSEDLFDQTTSKPQQANDINIDQYLSEDLFDQTTSKPSKEATEEEMTEITNHWLSMSDEEFRKAEQNLLDWAVSF